MGVKVVKEVVSGSGANLSLNAQGGQGSSQAGLRYQRAWKIVLDAPSDIVGLDVRDHIGVTIGQLHPSDPFCTCDSIDVKPDGESRHTYVVTATYSSSALSLQMGGLGDQNADPKSQSPETRKANWSTDVSTIEAPSWLWKPISATVGVPIGVGNWGWAVNPAGDLYDGVMTMQPIMSIKIEQTQAADPNIWAMFVGQVNSTQVRVGNLLCLPHSVMLKGISATPHAEVVGRQRWRGWKANYEFVYKPGYNSYMQQFLGWDIAIPVSGFNVKNVNGALADPTVEKGALSLKLTNDTVGTIDGWENAAVIEPTLVGKVTRANVLVSAPGAKAMQRPCAQPVPLNWNGTPRKVDPAAQLWPIVQVTQVYADFDMNNMNLRVD